MEASDGASRRTEPFPRKCIFLIKNWPDWKIEVMMEKVPLQYGVLEVV